MFKLKKIKSKRASVKSLNKTKVKNGAYFNTSMRIAPFHSNVIQMPLYRSTGIVWAKAAQIASSSLNDEYVFRIEAKLNSFKNGSSKEFNKIYALKLNPKYRAIFERTTEGYKVLDIVNSSNYDPKKVVEIF